MTDKRIIAYLLEELPEDDLERFEQECFAQEEWPAQINLVEEDLIEAYLSDELTPERRQRFERNYLTTAARHERVVLTAALLRYVDERNAASNAAGAVSPPERLWTERFRAFWSSQSWALRAVTAVAVIALIAGALWFLFPHAPSPKTFASLTLTTSNSNRAEGAPAVEVKLTPDVEALKISLRLPQPPPTAARYRVELENDNGETKSVEVAGEDTQSVLVVIPAAQLARGQYALKLFAIQTDGTEQRINGSYFFIVK
jgi:methionine-rich copper-binding protein CopC